MEPNADDLQKQLGQFLSHLDEQKEALEAQAAKWRSFQDDYNALEKQLQTLPDQTSRSAMIPIGQLAFMPGKIIHTNEILVLLGDQYYAERSAKQAVDIVKRRKQVVNENLSLVEAQLNALKSKSDIAYATDVGVNEEGLPIMEIREELPKEETVKKKPKPDAQAPSKMPPAKKGPVNEKEYKEVMDLLEKMELEEERLEQSGQLQEAKEDSREHSENEEDEDDEEEDEDLYDREISDTIFDHFDDDEEYAMQGIVEQEDATVHDMDTSKLHHEKDNMMEESPVVMPVKEHVTTTDTRSDISAVSSEKKKKISKFKAARLAEKTTNTAVPEEPASIPAKKVSKFKSACQQKKEAEQPAPVEPVQAPAKEVSKFKAARQECKALEDNGQEKADSKKHSVTWDSVATVREHDTSAAPAEPTTASYNAPVKQEHVPGERTLQKTIKSPADIFSIVKEQAQIPLSLEDDYPSLDMDSENSSEPIDFMELAEKAKTIPQKIYTTLQEPKPVKPMIQEMSAEPSLPRVKPSKMDTPTMKGVVMERETAPVDLEQVEEDMDFREISTRYHQKRLDYYAAMNGFANNEESWQKEVIDEELPLPSRQNEEPEDENPRPRRISKFKAARLSMNIQDMKHS